ncbi:MAG: leucine-rich repeat protein [Acutalibacteraceae bacterium]
MKNFKKLLSSLLVAVMILTAAPLSGLSGLDVDFDLLDFTQKASALDSSGSCGDNVTYTFDSATGLLTISGTGEMYDAAFKYSSLIKAVVIEDGVTTIGNDAFRACGNLSRVTIPDSVTKIGDNAFYGCSMLSSLLLGDGVTSIGTDAFKDASGLYLLVYKDTYAEQYAVDNSVNYRILSTIPEDIDTVSGELGTLSSWTLDKATGTLTVDYKGVMISFKDSVAPWCQYEEYIKHIVISDSCTSIGRNAFALCTKAESVMIPDSVTIINHGAFYGCIGLKELTLPCSAKTYNDKNTYFNCSGVEKVTFTKGTGVMQNYGFDENSSNITYYQYTPWYLSRGNIIEITLEHGITHIGNYAFDGCNGIKAITIPDSVTNIGNGSFKACRGIESITIPDSVTSLADYAFEDCTYLTEIQLPDRIKSLGRWVFSGCTALTSAELPDGLTDLPEGTFNSCESLTDVKLPGSITSIGDGAFLNCESLAEIDIPDSVTSISRNVFYGCKSLNSITIPDSVINIGDDAFRGCAALTSVTVPDSVTTIGDAVFYNCTNLNSAVIPDSVTDIGAVVFNGCKNLETLYIGCPEVDSHYFESFTKLKNVTIGSNVKAIRAYAFSSCTGLEEMVLPYNIGSIGKEAFTGCANLNSLIVYNRDCVFEDVLSDDNTVIYGFTGSTAQAYADENGFEFIPLDGIHTHVYDDEDDYICDLCGVDKSKCEHDYIASVTAPTCTEQGYTTYTCSKCGDSYISDYVDALGQVYSVAVDDISLNYKKTATLNTVVTADEGANYTVAYTSSDPSVAKVDENGNVYGAKKGSAEITVTVTDECGNTVTDICTVKVTYSAWQWVIKILLFGWLWY